MAHLWDLKAVEDKLFRLRDSALLLALARTPVYGEQPGDEQALTRARREVADAALPVGGDYLSLLSALGQRAVCTTAKRAKQSACHRASQAPCQAHAVHASRAGLEPLDSHEPTICAGLLGKLRSQACVDARLATCSAMGVWPCRLRGV